MAGSPYTLQSRPGALLEASRNPKMKRAVMKAIGMPMKKRKSSKVIKMTGTYKGKSNTLGHGGRAAQLTSKLRSEKLPGGEREVKAVVGIQARRAQAAPGQKNYHGKKKVAKKGTKMNPAQEMAMKKARKGSIGLVKAPSSRYMRKGIKKKSSKRYLNAPLAATPPPSATSPSANASRPVAQMRFGGTPQGQNTPKVATRGFANAPYGAGQKARVAMQRVGALKSAKRRKSVKKK